jgi:CBS domain containing-hemolysin-like protein
MSSDLLALLAAVLLLLANAFFVGAEFALISARRDRLEAMARAGTPSASTVLRAGGDLTRMLAAAQLGITICSLLLGRLGEPAVAHLIERPFNWLGLPFEVLGPVAFAISLVVVVVAHMVIGEMVPKNIAIAGPERTALWLVPPFLAFTTAMRPFISLFNHMANGVLRLIRVEPRDELETAVTSDQLADLIAESRREGLLDDDGSSRLARTLSSAGHTVADVLVAPVELVSLPQRPVVDDVARAVADTGFSRFPVRAGLAGGFLGYLHVKDILDIADDPAAEVPSGRIRRLPQVRVTDRLDVALAVLRRAGAHLGRVVDPAGATAGLVTLEDLVEHYVGTVRDATHAREEPA